MVAEQGYYPEKLGKISLDATMTVKIYFIFIVLGFLLSGKSS